MRLGKRERAKLRAERLFTKALDAAHASKDTVEHAPVGSSLAHLPFARSRQPFVGKPTNKWHLRPKWLTGSTGKLARG